MIFLLTLQTKLHSVVLLVSRTSLDGSLNSLCTGRTSQMSKLSDVGADCDGANPEVFCTCCNICCQDDTDKDETERTCRRNVFYGNIDPSWEHSFIRKDYTFKKFSVTEDGGS